MNPRIGRRSWIKLWVNEWLDGTTRYQMTSAQRALWVDLLAMAGRSKFGGVVCSGKDGDTFIGYPVGKFQGLIVEPIDILATFELFRDTKKIRIEESVTDPKLYVLFILSWDTYQSEYERVKKSREKSTPKVQEKYVLSNKTEVEVEVDSEGEVEKEQPSVATPPVTDPLPQRTRTCFKCGEDIPEDDAIAHTRTCAGKKKKQRTPKSFSVERGFSKPQGSAVNWSVIPLFENFWEMYPDPPRANRVRTLETWRNKILNLQMAMECVASLMRWKECEQWMKGYITSPAKFLEEERWKEEPPKNAPNKAELRDRKNVEAVAEGLRRRRANSIGVAGEVLKELSTRSGSG
jgi:hypothetical protein